MKYEPDMDYPEIFEERTKPFDDLECAGPIYHILNQDYPPPDPPYGMIDRDYPLPTNPGISNSYERMGNVNKNNKGSHGLEPNKDGSLSLAPKNLMMMPARIAIAMQERGWILRSEIIWSKRNSLPESVKDRPTCAHEKVFLFAKRQKYFYDHVAVQTKTCTASTRHCRTQRQRPTCPSTM